MSIAYRLAVYDRKTERLIGSHEIPSNLNSATRRIALIPTSDDSFGDYPLGREQAVELGKKLGATVHPELFDYFIEPNVKSPFFLSEGQVPSEIRKLLQGPEPHRMAVAFWGDGASNLLGLRSDCPPVEIICNLTSGGTNPSEIRKILKASRGHRVYSNPRLHAKMYLSGRSAIIGSSNASANGLALEGRELEGWLEANLFVEDAEVVSKAHKYFKRIQRGAVEIQLDSDLLNAADLAWFRARDREQPVRRRSPRSLLHAIRSNDPELKKLPIRFEFELPLNPSSWAEQEAKTIRENKVDEIHDEASGAEIDFWQNWPEALPGTYYICFGPRGGWKGIWKTPAVNHVRRLGKDRSITICYKKADVEGFVISEIDRHELGQFIVELARRSERDDFTLSEVCQQIQDREFAANPRSF